MALSELQLASETIKVGDRGSFDVRAMCADDVSYLIKYHEPDLSILVEAAQKMGDKSVSEAEALTAFFGAAIQEFPKLAARIIACASDDTSEGGVRIAGRLPLPVQLDAISAISRLTFEEYGGVKKFVDTVKSLIGGMKNKMILSP